MSENPLQTRLFAWRVHSPQTVILITGDINSHRASFTNTKSPQVIQNKYFVHNSPVFNILQTHPAPKSMERNDFLPKYPEGGGGRGTGSRNTKEFFIASVTKSASHLHLANLRRTEKN
jgi:hypothetical protein